MVQCVLVKPKLLKGDNINNSGVEAASIDDFKSLC